MQTLGHFFEPLYMYAVVVWTPQWILPRFKPSVGFLSCAETITPLPSSHSVAFRHTVSPLYGHSTGEHFVALLYSIQPDFILQSLSPLFYLLSITVCSTLQCKSVCFFLIVFPNSCLELKLELISSRRDLICELNSTVSVIFMGFVLFLSQAELLH